MTQYNVVDAKGSIIQENLPLQDAIGLARGFDAYIQKPDGSVVTTDGAAVEIATAEGVQVAPPAAPQPAPTTLPTPQPAEEQIEDREERKAAWKLQQKIDKGLFDDERNLAAMFCMARSIVDPEAGFDSILAEATEMLEKFNQAFPAREKSAKPTQQVEGPGIKPQSSRFRTIGDRKVRISEDD